MPKYRVAKGRVAVRRGTIVEMEKGEAERYGSRLEQIKTQRKQSLHVQPETSGQSEEKSESE